MKLDQDPAGAFMQGYREGLLKALQITREEPELPFENGADYIAAVIVWLFGVLRPIRTARATVHATKLGIARKISAERSRSYHENGSDGDGR